MEKVNLILSDVRFTGIFTLSLCPVYNNVTIILPAVLECHLSGNKSWLAKFIYIDRSSY